jgi:ElaB/YqjD/DUF883 family membrane-anchored ribosome-binding protein
MGCGPPGRFEWRWVVAIDEVQHAQGTEEGAISKVQEAAGQAKEQVLETAGEVKGRGLEQVRSQLDTQSTNLSQRIAPVAEAVRKAGRHLQEEGNEAGAKGADQVATWVDRLAVYLRDAQSDRILGDVEAFARRRPWATGAIGATFGFIGARFLKASSPGAAQPTSRSVGRMPVRSADEFTEAFRPTVGSGSR